MGTGTAGGAAPSPPHFPPPKADPLTDTPSPWPPSRAIQFFSPDCFPLTASSSPAQRRPPGREPRRHNTPFSGRRYAQRRPPGREPRRHVAGILCSAGAGLGVPQDHREAIRWYQRAAVAQGGSPVPPPRTTSGWRMSAGKAHRRTPGGCPSGSRLAAEQGFARGPVQAWVGVIPGRWCATGSRFCAYVDEHRCRDRPSGHKSPPPQVLETQGAVGGS